MFNLQDLFISIILLKNDSPIKKTIGVLKKRKARNKTIEMMAGEYKSVNNPKSTHQFNRQNVIISK